MALSHPVWLSDIRLSTDIQRGGEKDVKTTHIRFDESGGACPVWCAVVYLAIKKGLEERTGMILFVAGLVLLGLGIVRTWLVAHFIKMAEMTDENSSL